MLSYDGTDTETDTSDDGRFDFDAWVDALPPGELKGLHMTARNQAEAVARAFKGRVAAITNIGPEGTSIYFVSPKRYVRVAFALPSTGWHEGVVRLRRSGAKGNHGKDDQSGR